MDVQAAEYCGDFIHSCRIHMQWRPLKSLFGSTIFSWNYTRTFWIPLSCTLITVLWICLHGTLLTTLQQSISRYDIIIFRNAYKMG